MQCSPTSQGVLIAMLKSRGQKQTETENDSNPQAPVKTCWGRRVGGKHCPGHRDTPHAGSPGLGPQEDLSEQT